MAFVVFTLKLHDTKIKKRIRFAWLVGERFVQAQNQ